MKLQNLNYGIVGLGIMGGSFAKSIRENILCMAESTGKIFACNRSQACIQQALSEGVIDEGFSTENVSDMVKKCDVIFICLYPHIRSARHRPLTLRSFPNIPILCLLLFIIFHQVEAQNSALDIHC